MITSKFIVGHEYVRKNYGYGHNAIFRIEKIEGNKIHVKCLFPGDAETIQDIDSNFAKSLVDLEDCES